MKILLLLTFSLVGGILPVAQAGTEADRLRSVIAKKDHEIRELRKEIDGLHRQLAEEQPYRLASQPKETKAPTAPIAKPAPNSPATGSYTVKSGDTLSGIARRHGISVKQLKSENQLKSDMIRLGQKLRVPSASEQKTAISENTPKAKPAPQKAAPSPAEPKPAAIAQTYKIKAGDSFYSIARREGVTVAEIQKANPKVQASRLRIGQTIKLPGSEIAAAPAQSQPVSQTILATDKPELTSPLPSETPKTAPVPKQKRVSEVELTKEMTFQAFAKEQGMSMARLNELNGHKLGADEWLAVGSLFYVEK